MLGIMAKWSFLYHSKNVLLGITPKVLFYIRAKGSCWILQQKRSFKFLISEEKDHVAYHATIILMDITDDGGHVGYAIYWPSISVGIALSGQPYNMDCSAFTAIIIDEMIVTHRSCVFGWEHTCEQHFGCTRSGPRRWKAGWPTWLQTLYCSWCQLYHTLPLCR